MSGESPPSDGAALSIAQQGLFAGGVLVDVETKL